MPTNNGPSLFKALPIVAISSPIGKLWVQSDGELITRLSFDSIAGRKTRTPNVLKLAAEQLDNYFNGKLKEFDLPLQQSGTRFQKMVWNQLVLIPPGKTRSYKEVGDLIGGKGIARTVGGACGRNPLPILVPCHRVIGSSGLLTGYVGGIWRKRWLLEHEGALSPGFFTDK
jgi:methylated-DNA-[protein]-cysteine S-methyltransferase